MTWVVRYSKDNNSLSHHGILGQKWGKRNGPPYPLDSNDHSAREKKAGWRKSLGGVRNEELYDREDKDYKKAEKEHDKNIDVKKKADKNDLDFVTNKDSYYKLLARYAKTEVKDIVSSKEFKIAVGIGVGLLAIYAAKRLSARTTLDLANNDHVANLMEIDSFSDAQDNFFKSLDDVPLSQTNYHDSYFKHNDLSILLDHNNYYDDGELTKLVKNPFKLMRYAYDDPDGFSQILNRSNNCTFCTTSLVMRLKGYDVMAQPTNTGSGWSPGMIKEWFEDADVVAPHKYSRSSFLKELMAQGNGAYGNLICYWKTGGGHSILYTVKEDGVHFIDGQIGKEYTYHELFSKMFIENCRYARLDNCNPTDLLLKTIMPAIE